MSPFSMSVLVHILHSTVNCLIWGYHLAIPFPYHLPICLCTTRCRGSPPCRHRSHLRLSLCSHQRPRLVSSRTGTTSSHHFLRRSSCPTTVTTARCHLLVSVTIAALRRWACHRSQQFSRPDLRAASSRRRRATSDTWASRRPHRSRSCPNSTSSHRRCNRRPQRIVRRCRPRFRCRRVPSRQFR